MKMLKSDKSKMLLAALCLASMLGAQQVFAADDPADPPAVQEQPAAPEVPKTAPAPAAETAPPAATMQNAPAAPDPADTSAPPTQTAAPASVQAPVTARASAKSAAKNPAAPAVADRLPGPPVSSTSTPPVADSPAPAPAENATAASPAIPAVQAPAAATATVNSGALQTTAEIVLAIALLALIALGIASRSMTRNRLAQQSAMMQQSLAAKRAFWTSGSLQQGAMGLEVDSPFRYISELGLRAFEHNQTAGRGKIGGRVWIASVIRHACENVQGSLQQGPAAVADAGTAALVVGLLGAVCGGYAALAGFDAASGAGSAGFAIPLGGALLSAILGFGIAVSSMSNRERLDRGNSAYMAQVRDFCTDLRVVLCTDGVTHVPMPMAAGAN
jgi:biopolymer transport protein ExbB